MPGEIEELQAWYEARCDGEWEHEFGISIETLDNPGWSVEIDLEGTTLESIAFTQIHDLAHEREWISCRVEDRRFLGAGGAPMLGAIIRTFLDWARQRPAASSGPAR